jgi:hypothetical protein
VKNDDSNFFLKNKKLILKEETKKRCKKSDSKKYLGQLAKPVIQVMRLR